MQLKCITTRRADRARTHAGERGPGEYFRMLSGRAVARMATKCNLTVHDARARALFIANTAPRTAFRRHFPPHTYLPSPCLDTVSPGYLNRLIESPFQPTLHHIKLASIASKDQH